MSKKTLGFTVVLAWLVGSIGQAGELSQDQLDEVVAFAQAQDYYNCNNFKDAYRHPSMNQVYAVDAHSIYRVACVQAAYLAVSPPLTEVIRLEITDPFDKATLYYVRTTDYAPYRP